MIVRTSLLGVLCAFSLSPAVNAWDRGEVKTFARLPPGQHNPEGIAVHRHTGDVYVADFDLSRLPNGPGQVVVFNKEGKLLRVLTIPNSSALLLGLDFHPSTGDLLVIDFGGAKVLRVDPQRGTATTFATIPKDPEGKTNPGPNALTFDATGNVYISDSFQGIIWRAPADSSGQPAQQWARSPLLTTTGAPPFGANGIAFNRSANTMFVANTGDDTIVKIPVVDGAADGTHIAVFTNSINGADGLAMDENDNIWVCANQSDEIVVVDHTGKAIAKLGDFEGIRNGEARGLLFPASLVFTGDSVLVTNLALNTAAFGFNTVDTGWSQQVHTFTVSKIRRRIPRANGDRDRD